MNENVKNSLRVLLSEIVDYAGLFPPAQLSMAAAAQNFNDYLNSKHAWMLGRFIVPADLLEEFTVCAAPFWERKNSKPWRVSVLARESLQETVRKIENFNRAHTGKAFADTLEARAETGAEIRAAREFLPAGLTTYFEIPLAAQLPDQISALAVTRTRAKIRTGGVVPEAFPPIDELIKFLRICIAANVPLKATAGLHHPLRSSRALTYEPDAPIGFMHGFLNLFLSAAFLRQNLNNTFVHKLMADTDAAHFTFDDDAAQWSGHRVELAQLKLLRERNIVSFGSCSFVEPLEDLRQLGIL
jgi:hypothetical protein